MATAPRYSAASPPTGISSARTRRSPWHWEAWALRSVLLVACIYHLATRNVGGAATAGEGFVVTLAPLLVQRLSRTHLPRAAELAFVLTLTLQSTSESFKLFEIYYYWDKICHPAEIFFTVILAAYLLLGYLDTCDIHLPRPLAGAIVFIFGGTLGMLWEFFEFTSDWFNNTDLQKSNADTMTDMLANVVGAYLGMLLAFWLYHRHTTAQQRTELGRIARWLGGGPGKVLDRYGGAIAALAALIVAGLLTAGWFVDRNPPGLPPGHAQGQSQTWTFTPDAAAPVPTAVLLGEWRPDERGMCRINATRPRPGSEKPGLLELAPGSVYGAEGGFVATTHYFEERPPKVEGSQMTAGLAFGIRDAEDFYLVEASALHDIVRLDRYLHGRRRDLREKRVRTHGNEWHELQVRVQGDRVAASLDGRQIFEHTEVADVSGDLGVWARVSAAGCFSQMSVQTLPPDGQV